MSNLRTIRPVFAALLLLAPMLLVNRVLAAADTPLANDLRISQVYGGGGNSGATYTNDFIEIFNGGASTVSLAGYSVQYASSAGTTWQVTALSGSLAPGQYYLVQEAAGTGGTTALPTPDATGTIALSATSGKIALVSSITALSGSCPGGWVDMVGYGTADCYEGGAAAPTLSNTTLATRASNGCQDTDVNSADFSSLTAYPNARNTASALNPCTGSITIVKDASPADGTDFAFISGALGNFVLDDEPVQPTDTYTDTITFTNLLPGSYSVAETVTGDWALTNLTCDSGSWSVDGASVTVDLAAGEDVTCTFENTIQPGSITIIKDAAPADGTDFAFTTDALVVCKACFDG